VHGEDESRHSKKEVYLANKETRSFPSTMVSVPTTVPEFEETQWFYRRWWWLLLGLAGLAIIPLAFVSNKPHGLQALLITAPLVLIALAGL